MLYILLRSSTVQTYITEKITSQLSRQLQTTISIEGVDIDFFKKFVLEKIYIEDQQQDTLLYADRLVADIGLFALFDKRITLDLIALENGYVNLYTIEGTEKLNYEFIPEAFATDTTQQDTTAAPWQFDLHEVSLENLRFSFNDKVADMELKLAVQAFLVKLETLGLEESHIIANKINIDGLHLTFKQPSSPDDTLSSDTTQVMDSAATAGAVTDTLNPSGFRFTINEFIISDSEVEYLAGGNAQEGKINFANLAIQNLNTEINNIEVGANSIEAAIKEFSFLEKNSGFDLQQLALDINLAMPSISAKLHTLKTGYSELNGEISLVIPSINTNENLLQELQLMANLKETNIGLQDASYFMNALDSIPAVSTMNVLISGNAEVRDGEGKVEKLFINAGNQARLSADVAIDNLVNINNAYLDLQVKAFSSNFDFISKFLAPGSLPMELRKAGKVTLTANAEGYLADIDLKTNINSSLGKIFANINYKGNEDESFAIKGEVNGNNIKLRTLTGNDSLGNLAFTSDFDAFIAGSNIRMDSANLTIKNLEFNSYTYTDLQVNASFVDSLLTANVRYNDEFLNLNLDGLANLKEAESSVILNGSLDMNLFRLNLNPDSIILKTAINADLKGLDIDNINGYLQLSGTELIKGIRKYNMDTFTLTAETTDTLRSINLTSDFMRAEIQGQFQFATLPDAIADFTKHYFTSYKKDSIIKVAPQNFEFNAEIWDEPLIVKTFFPMLSLPEPVSIYSKYIGENYLLELDISIPEIIYAENKINGLEVNAGTSENNIKFEILADNAVIGENIILPQPGFSGSFIQDMMQFNLKLANSENPSYLDLNGFLTNNEDTITLEVLESSMAIEEEQWNMPEKGKVIYAPEYLMVKNIRLLQDDQSMTVNTEEEQSENSRLNLSIKNLGIGDLFKIAGLEDYQVQGTLNGDAVVVDILNMKEANVDFTFSEIMINEQKAADIHLLAGKSADEERLDIDLSMSGPNNDFKIAGTYNLADTANALAINVDIDKFRLEQWGVFAQKFVTDLSGNIRSEMNITGSLTQPVVEGYLAFDPKTVMRIKAIGSLYKFDDQQITFTEQSLRFQQFTILDSANHEVVINGNIDHEYFDNFMFDLAVNTEEFKFFNAKEDDSPAFYGSINAQAEMGITGPMDNLVIKGSLKTMEGTDAVVAMVDEPGEVTRADYINFINTNAYEQADSTARDSIFLNDKVALSGININVRLTVTPVASIRIVVDPVNGDHLLARGEGEFLINMNSLGDLNVQGTYTIDRGSYALSFLGVVKKNFEIRQGSRIELTGDPMNAEFNIEAVYHTEASADGLVQIPQGDPESQRELTVKQPVNVVLLLQGTIAEPIIDFDIELPAQKSEFSLIAQRIEMIKSDKTQLFQQVFGLIVLNRFIPPSGPLGGSGGGAAAAVNQRVDASVSSMLTMQLSRLTEDYLGGVELNVNLESRDAANTSFDNKDLEVQLSKTLFNERLTVTVGGTSDLGGGSGPSEGAGIAGDFEIVYRLNESGTLSLRIFQNNERDIFTDQYNRRQGISLSYQKSFDEFFEGDEDVLKSAPPPEDPEAGRE